MTDVTELQNENDTPVVEEINYKELYEKTKADLTAVAAKKEELLNETKKAKEARREADENARKASEEKAAKDGEYEKLWQKAKEEKEELNKRLQDITTSNRREKINLTAMRIANDLADGDNAELLSDFVSRNLDKLADDTGVVTGEVLEAVTNDFKNSTKYKSLLRSSKASGGGAPGNTSGAQVNVKTMTRSEFDGLDQVGRGKFFTTGGALID